MAMAQQLLFNYSLGKKTLMTNVYRLEPATLLRIFGNSLESRVDNIHHFNFEKKSYYEDITKVADELVSLFSTACKNRVDLNNKNILSLSGGHDSRAVAAALDKNSIPFIAATFLDPNKKYSTDIEVAEKLAWKLNIECERYYLSPPSGNDLDTLLRIKNGLNYLAMAYILQFFDNLSGKHGSRVTYITGDGGDKVLVSLDPAQKMNSLDDLVDYTISMNHVFSISDVAAITNIPENEIIDGIKNNLSTYPEKALSQKYVHFLIYERAFKWFFEGEDRNRFYFWSVTPFNSIPFFDYAMKCPDKIKSYDTLYQAFMSRLSPSIATVDYVGRPRVNQSTLSRHMYDTQLYLKRRLIKSSLFPLYTPFTGPSYNRKSNTIKCLQQQIDNCDIISRHMSPFHLARVINNSSKYYKTTLNNLFTITSFIEKLFCNTRTISKYHGDYFT